MMEEGTGWGYDLDDDGKEDIVLGISNKVCAVASPLVSW